MGCSEATSFTVFGYLVRRVVSADQRCSVSNAGKKAVNEALSDVFCDVCCCSMGISTLPICSSLSLLLSRLSPSPGWD